MPTPATSIITDIRETKPTIRQQAQRHRRPTATQPSKRHRTRATYKRHSPRAFEPNRTAGKPAVKRVEPVPEDTGSTPEFKGRNWNHPPDQAISPKKSLRTASKWEKLRCLTPATSIIADSINFVDGGLLRDRNRPSGNSRMTLPRRSRRGQVLRNAICVNWMRGRAAARISGLWRLSSSASRHRWIPSWPTSS